MENILAKTLILAMLTTTLLSISDRPEFQSNDIPVWNRVYSELSPPANSRPGEVISRESISSKMLVRSEVPYDPLVYGVTVEDSTGKLRIAIGGEVSVIVDPTSNRICAGDWLVSSGSTGKVISASSDWPVKPVVIGISLDSWSPDDTSGVIRILLTPGERVTVPEKNKD